MHRGLSVINVQENYAQFGCLLLWNDISSAVRAPELNELDVYIDSFCCLEFFIVVIYCVSYYFSHIIMHIALSFEMFLKVQILQKTRVTHVKIFVIAYTCSFNSL